MIVHLVDGTYEQGAGGAGERSVKRRPAQSDRED